MGDEEVIGEHERGHQGVRGKRGSSEVREVRHFQGYRNTAAGPTTVHITIFDGGSEAGAKRYSCRAVSENGRVTRGNEAESIDTALAITRWNELG